MSYGTEYVATVRPEQAAWLTGSEYFDGTSAGVDNGDGTVTLTEEQVDVLRERDTGEGRPGDLEWDDEHGLLVYLPDGGDCRGFWLVERLRTGRS
ncbi:hypothetical protein O7630_11615 [Micromonospora sp. WMMD718]|uniref:hypothetical protein n=1 Tax=unclassified Micromonospora TaxID=2617518 RepID=UPI00064BD6E3|nr:MULTISPECIES: hypothetical protein [unclassified Micromonospora]MDG4751590.1 hypothetical protein [Micromonospora sp. WMMD718]